ncbi:MAG: elongation factor G, partial [Phycisphaerales bacterium]
SDLSIKERLGANPIAVQYPIGKADTFEGIIDLIKMKAYYFDASELGAKVEERDIPDNLRETAELWRHELVEKAAECDDNLMEKYLADEAPSDDEIIAALRKGTIARECYPTFCGSALKYIGVQRLINGVILFLPSPNEVPEVRGIDVKDEDKALTRPHKDTAPLSALVFKVVSDIHGDLTYTRVYSGKLKKGERVSNPNTGKKEIVSRIFEMHAKERIPLEEAGAGSIVAVVGLKDSGTGDTLCDPDQPIILEKMTFPEPVISMSIEPKTADDRRKLGEALVTIKREDPSFRAKYDEETGQTIIAGMGELHLEIIKNKLVRDMKINVEVGRPRVSYRETITGSATEVRGRFVKQTGGRGQFGDCTINIEPYTTEQAEEDGLKFVENVAFENKIVGGSIPKEYIPSVEYGVRQTALGGVMAGYQLINIKVTLVDGSYHPVDSSQVAFEQAGRLALNEACRKAGMTLLEPIMKVVVITPEDYFGSVTGDLSSRRGMVVGTEERGNTKVITAEVPLSEMFGYVTTLRSLTQGRANSSMEPLTYRPLPPNLAKEVAEAV